MRALAFSVSYTQVLSTEIHEQLFSNLCHHKEDHGLDAEWNFFATSHGKSAYDGIGGTVKRLAARASLQRPLDHQILTPQDLYSWCIENIKNIVFFFVNTSECTEVSKEQEKRFSLSKTIPGTPSFHWFVPLSTTEVQVGYICKLDASWMVMYLVRLVPGCLQCCESTARAVYCLHL